MLNSISVSVFDPGSWTTMTMLKVRCKILVYDMEAMLLNRRNKRGFLNAKRIPGERKKR
jgi:hypothetical protein